MKKILFVCALSKELNIVKNSVISFFSFGKVGKGFKPLFFVTGTGNYNTILNLTKFLEHNEIDFVVNIGVCGKKAESGELKVKDNFIQVARIFNLANGKELIIPQVLEFGKLVSIAASEKPVFDEKDLIQFSSNMKNKNIGEKFVDMESYGFEMVCDSFSLPRIILKVPVDKIGTETKNFDYKRALDKLKENIPYEKLVKEIVEYLEGIEEKMDFKEYFRVFNFTFSEKEIFKKLYYKLKAKKPVFVLGHGDGKLKENYIDEFLRNGKKLDKKDSKEFLQNLQKILG